MVLNLLDIQSDDDLLKKLERAKSVRMTASEIFEQRVSFAYGSLGEKNTLTKDDVRRIVSEREGRDIESAVDDTVRTV